MPEVAALVAEYISNSTLPHHGYPHGVPTNYSWRARPIVPYPAPPIDMTAVQPWGHLYVDHYASTTAPNTRVELGELTMHLLTTSGWVSYQWLASNGYWYNEDFGGDIRVNADQRLEPGGYTSVTSGNGKVFHWYPSGGQTSIANGSTIGVIISQRARLIVADPHQPDDRASARYILGVGADWWRHIGAPWLPDFSNNPNVGIGRFRYVTSEWQTFRFSSIGRDVLTANPPPS